MKVRTTISMITCAAVLLSGCASMSKTSKGALIGAGAGAAVGAGVGALVGKDGKSAAIGAAIGGSVGAGAGALIGRKMDKKAKELAALENAAVETITDNNGLAAIKVTFDSGILFAKNSSDLSAASKTELKKFATAMKDMTDTDITIYGHTDNTGTAAVNEKVSAQRASAVADYLKSCGIAKDRMKTEGMSFNMPVADNSTEKGRAANRRVEIYISADENMIKAAENGTL
ncbi:MAG: OmpA family protein [Bacteroidales bacterium]|nr:OmpA family protein [Bacteroidales bacterium]